MLFIIILRQILFEFGVNINSVKSLEKFFPTTTYYYIRALLSILFIKIFLLNTKMGTNVYLQKIAKAKLPQNINNILRKFGFVYFSDILLLEQGG